MSDAKNPSFKAKYKLHGIITSVVIMWLDYALIHNGLTHNDPMAIGAGMAIMVLAVGIGFFFG
jgi:hypothetical protein